LKNRGRQGAVTISYKPLKEKAGEGKQKKNRTKSDEIRKKIGVKKEIPTQRWAGIKSPQFRQVQKRKMAPGGPSWGANKNKPG